MSFDKQDRGILTNKPKIEYESDYLDDPEIDNMSIDITDITDEDVKQRLSNLIAGYKKVEDLASVLEKQIDKRVGDNYNVQLDPINDAAVIDAIGRCFPEAKDKRTISYEMYKQCLARQSKNAENNVLKLNADDIKEAVSGNINTKVDFGSYGKSPGYAINNIPQIIKPIDLEQYKSDGIAGIYKEIQNFVISDIKRMIKMFVPFADI